MCSSCPRLPDPSGDAPAAPAASCSEPPPEGRDRSVRTQRLGTERSTQRRQHTHQLFTEPVVLGPIFPGEGGQRVSNGLWRMEVDDGGWILMFRE